MKYNTASPASAGRGVHKIRILRRAAFSKPEPHDTILYMRHIAVIIYGPPGSGKGTQANLLSWNLGLIHFDTGRFCEQLVHDPANQGDPVIQRERKLFDTGMLMTPSFVLTVVKEKTDAIAKAGLDIVYSGSPRTMYEAFGDASAEGLIPFLERVYGKDNIRIVMMKIEPQDAIKRNKVRLVCSVCRTPVMEGSGNSSCSICGGALTKRTLDSTDVLETRIREYEERTFPIIEELEKREYVVRRIDARPLPYEIHKTITGYIG